jgi:putative endonuclease
MFPGRALQLTIKLMDRLAARMPQRSPAANAKSRPAEHLLTGKAGEEEAYFYLRRRGYVMIARNYRTPRHHGEIDLIGWDKDVLCFIEVKTRTTRDVKPAEAAVDRRKRHDLRLVIRDYLRTLPRKRFPEPPAWRFDVVTVQYDRDGQNQEEQQRPAKPSTGSHQSARNVVGPTFELFQNASLSS